MDEGKNKFTAYFTDEEKRLLKLIADSEDRSMNYMLARLIREEAARRNISPEA